MCESLRISSGPVGSISIIMYLLESCLSFLRMLRIVFGPRRERNHPMPPPCPLTEDANTFPDICSCLHCFQFNQPFSHKFKNICHRVYLVMVNWGKSKQESQEKLISNSSGVSCDIKEGHLASEAMYLPQCPVTSIAQLKSLVEDAVISAIINSQRHRESSVSDSLLCIHKASLG